MQTFIWAFGSMIVLLLVLFFLPLGFTLKGKLSIVLASFVISLGGLAASNTFSLPVTTVLLFVLCILITYILEKRAGRILYGGIQLLEEKIVDLIDNESSIEDLNIKTEKGSKFQELNALEIGEPPLLNKVDESIGEGALVSKPKIGESGHEEASELIDEDISLLLKEDTKQNGSFHEGELESGENYFSEIENDLIIAKVEEENSNSDEGYLADIESLLIENLEESFTDVKEEALLNERGRISKLESDELEPLDDDSTLDFLYATKEVASGMDEETENIEQEKLLQK